MFKGKKSPFSVSVAAAELGSLGGKKGGPARAKALSDSERSRIARKGGEAKGKSK